MKPVLAQKLKLTWNFFCGHLHKKSTLEVSKIRYLSDATDSSNHGAIKLFPILIQYFNPEKGRTQVHLLELQVLLKETAETKSKSIHSVLNDKNLLDKLITFSADNTKANYGGREKPGTNNLLQYTPMNYSNWQYPFSWMYFTYIQQFCT